MQINQISISNFKLFADSKFKFHPSFNLIVGTNGSGKTSLLRAVAVALGAWSHAYIKNPKNDRPIGDDEIREVQKDKRFDKTKKVKIEATGKAAIIDNFNNLKDSSVIWARYKSEYYSSIINNGYRQLMPSGKYSDTLNSEEQIKYSDDGNYYKLNFDDLGNNILNYIERGGRFDLPIIAFYECDRLWMPKSEIKLEESALLKYSRFDAYLDCFHTGADHKSLGQWILKHQLASLQQKIETPILLSIKSAAKSALDGCSDLRFDFEEGRVIVEFSDGHAIPFEHLSDGQRTMLGLFCDIARRAALLNPHLGGDASAKTVGVVLIDELDLHLHPKWQRRIIEDLRRTFPKIQFICTTHSPFLIQSLRSGEELIVLDGQSTAQVNNMPIDEIARGLMGVSNTETSMRYDEMKQMAKTYLEQLEDANLTPEDKLNDFLDHLAQSIAPYADNPAFQAFLEMKRAVKLGV